MSPSQKLCVAEPEAIFQSSAEPCAVRGLIRLSASPSFAAATNLSLSTTTGPDKVAHFMLKQLPHSDIEFLVHIFNLSWSLHSFPSIWKTSFIFPIHKMGKPLDCSAFFQPVSLTFCISKLFECITLSQGWGTGGHFTVNVRPYLAS